MSFVETINSLLKNDSLILDSGTGKGYWGYYIKLNFKNNVIIGLDIWEPYIRILNSLNLYDHLIINDFRYLPFRNNVINLTLGLEIFEHGNKEDNLILFDEFERITNKRIILSTPIYFQRNYKVNGNPYQLHKSRWKIRDFKKRNYKIIITSHAVMFINKMHEILFNIIKMYIFKRRVIKTIVAWKNIYDC